MKKTLLLAFMILIAGCAQTNRAFIQDDIRIVPPVEQEHDDRGIIITAFNDGGTKSVKITDAEGKTFNIYIDRRIDSKSPGAIYLNAYPGDSNSVRVVDQEAFKRKIGNFE
jgi:hypothetical protein